MLTLYLPKNGNIYRVIYYKKKKNVYVVSHEYYTSNAKNQQHSFEKIDT